MNKNSYYSLAALAMLFVSSVGLGIYAKISNSTIGEISADTVSTGLPLYEAVCRFKEVPLKTGVNTFTNNGEAFKLDDAVISYGDELINFNQAQAANLIAGVQNLTKGGEMGPDSQVESAESFSLVVLDGSFSLSLCLEDIR